MKKIIITIAALLVISSLTPGTNSYADCSSEYAEVEGIYQLIHNNARDVEWNINVYGESTGYIELLELIRDGIVAINALQGCDNADANSGITLYDLDKLGVLVNSSTRQVQKVTAMVKHMISNNN